MSNSTSGGFVSGLSGQSVTDVQVTIRGLTHTHGADLDISLQGPDGRRLMILSDALGFADLVDADLTFSDGATAIPAAGLNGGIIGSGSFRPMAYENVELGVQHANGDGTVSFGSVFDGAVPDGPWLLNIVDDAINDVGSFDSWSLRLSTDGDFANLSGSAADNLIFVMPASATSGEYVIDSGPRVQFSGVNRLVLSGEAGNDLLQAGSGNDVLDGGTGRDLSYGGAGNDAFFWEMGDTFDQEVYDGGSGTDTLRVTDNIELVADFRQAALRSIEVLTIDSSAILQTVILEARQFGAGLSSTARIEGSVFNQTVSVAMKTVLTLDLSGLTFIEFSGGE